MVGCIPRSRALAQTTSAQRHGHRTHRALAWLGPLGLVLACAGTRGIEVVAQIYDLPPEAQVTRHDPILVVPGFLGTVLEHRDTGEILWGRFLAKGANPKDPRVVGLLALPVRDEPLVSQVDELRPAEVLRVAEISIGRRTVKINAYPAVISGILAGWDDDEAGLKANDLSRRARNVELEDLPLLDEVAYDWRRDIPEATLRLDAHLDHSIALAKLHRREAGDPTQDVRIDVVGHSMGTLVLGYYMRYGTAPLPEDGSIPEPTWAGAEKVRRAMLVAPPILGTVKAFLTCAFGDRPTAILPEYPPVLGGTYVSLYQAMPAPAEGAVVYEDGETVDLYDPKVWERMRWGLFAPDADDLRAALMPGIEGPDERLKTLRLYQARVLRRAQQFHAAMRKPVPTPDDVELHLFASATEATAYRAVVRRKDGRLVRVETAPGDGVVTRHSALADLEGANERLSILHGAFDWSSVHWVRGTHLELLGEPNFVDNIMFLLFQSPPPRARDVAAKPALKSKPSGGTSAAETAESTSEVALDAGG